MARSDVVRAALLAALLFGGGLLMADHYDYSEEKTRRMLLAYGVCLVALLCVAWLLRRARHEAEDKTPDLRNQQQLESEMQVQEAIVPNTAIGISILLLGGMWVVAAIFALYPAVIPLMFLVAGAATVALFGVAARISAGVRAMLGTRGWIAFSVVAGVLIVALVVAYYVDMLRGYPLIALFCGALGVAITFCGVYGSAFTKNEDTEAVPPSGNQ